MEVGLGSSKQISDDRFFVNRVVKIAARDAQVGVACGVANLGQASSAS
jgi:hypothetical protein